MLTRVKTEPDGRSRVEVLLDVARDAHADCRARPDLGRDRVAVHLEGDDGHEVVLLMSGSALCELYIELRRFLGELGGYGPSRDEVHALLARASGSLPLSGAADAS